MNCPRRAGRYCFEHAPYHGGPLRGIKVAEAALSLEGAAERLEAGAVAQLPPVQRDSENRLTVVLVGHTELRRRMAIAALDALAQRIVLRANVRGIARDEMGAYLAHRIRLAGSELPVFAPTVEAIFQASSGLPRKANNLAHHSLFAAAIARAKTVTTEHVAAALQ